MFIDLDFRCTPRASLNPLCLPLLAKSLCKCTTAPRGFYEVHIDPPSDVQATKYLKNLREYGWRHVCTVIPVGTKALPTWTILTNGVRSSLIVDDMAHLFLVSSVAGEHDWYFDPHALQDPEVDSFVNFEWNERKFRWLSKLWMLLSGEPKTGQMMVFDAMGMEFIGTIPEEAAFVRVDSIRETPGPLGRVLRRVWS